MKKLRKEAEMRSNETHKNGFSVSNGRPTTDKIHSFFMTKEPHLIDTTSFLVDAQNKLSRKKLLKRTKGVAQ